MYPQYGRVIPNHSTDTGTGFLSLLYTLFEVGSEHFASGIYAAKSRNRFSVVHVSCLMTTSYLYMVVLRIDDSIFSRVASPFNKL